VTVAGRIEDHALIGDTQAAALVDRAGTIDWLCLPRFDSPACFASLVGTPDNGFWRLGPAAPDARVTRRYRGDSLVLETEFTTAEGTVRVVDCMPVRRDDPDLVRRVEGVRGRVTVRSDLRARFGYGRSTPWVRRRGEVVSLVAGPDALVLDTDVPVRVDEGDVTGEFLVGPGETASFVLEWHPSHRPWSGRRRDAAEEIAAVEGWWDRWASRTCYQGEWRDAVVRSLVTLKALTYAPTGGIVAAPTTSLPERLGGVRNWDYRFCWLRDATMTLDALLNAGYRDEAVAWRDWLVRAVAGSPAEMQIMYGLGGERLLPEVELGWLAGYEGSVPVRIGNGAVDQHQLDVRGEVMDALHEARVTGIDADEASWDLQLHLMDFLEGSWRDPDEGIWEVRGPRRHFTHSKVMAWVAADRAVEAIHTFGLPGDRGRWAALRDEVHADVCAHGWDDEAGTFTQYYGGDGVDAALLLIPQVGFLPPDDERVAGTVAAVERELCEDGLVHRYGHDPDVDGLPPGEGAFVACSFWLADAYALTGRGDDARATFERVLDLRNDVGLLAEEYDVASGRQLGNFPQAFSHVPLVNTALNLAGVDDTAHRRATTDRPRR
jgi:GH15 family glucan-1,4-alpha-glucosidase